ncbi:MAG TPA: hypothetical protein VGH27_35700 [Streptosporangiaceae bacterium]|jgi:hypothetical protein
MAEPADSLAADPSQSPSPRWHGTLDSITDSERRALRPIGMSAHEAAARTGSLLATLLSIPSVRIFQGIRPDADGLLGIPPDADGSPATGPPATGLQPIAHAVTAGHRLVFVESVAWPPGRYHTAAGGRIHCDGVYIGQSVRPLIAAVCRWREKLAPGHEVSALVVVHPTSRVEPALPDAIAGDLAWSGACDAVREVRSCLPPGRAPVSMKTLAALTQATALW